MKLSRRSLSSLKMTHVKEMKDIETEFTNIELSRPVKNLQLAVPLLNLFSSYMDSNSQEFTFKGFIEVLQDLKITNKDISIKTELRFINLFKELAHRKNKDKDTGEYVVEPSDFPELLNRAYSRKSESVVLLKTIINGANAAVLQKFPDLSTVIGDSGDSVIENVIIRDAFSDYSNEIKAMYFQAFGANRIRCSEIKIETIPKKYKMFLDFYTSAGVVPHLISDKALYLLINSLLCFYIGAKVNLPYQRGVARESPDRGNRDPDRESTADGTQNRVRSRGMNIMAKEQFTDFTAFKHLFQLVFAVIKQIKRVVIISSYDFQHKYVCLVMRKLLKAQLIIPVTDEKPQGNFIQEKILDPYRVNLIKRKMDEIAEEGKKKRLNSPPRTSNKKERLPQSPKPSSRTTAKKSPSPRPKTPNIVLTKEDSFSQFDQPPSRSSRRTIIGKDKSVGDRTYIGDPTPKHRNGSKTPPKSEVKQQTELQKRLESEGVPLYVSDYNKMLNEYLESPITDASNLIM